MYLSLSIMTSRSDAELDDELLLRGRRCLRLGLGGSTSTAITSMVSGSCGGGGGRTTGGGGGGGGRQTTGGGGGGGGSSITGGGGGGLGGSTGGMMRVMRVRTVLEPGMGGSR